MWAASDYATLFEHIEHMGALGRPSSLVRRFAKLVGLKHTEEERLRTLLPCGQAPCPLGSG
jgi:hypothetical protein